jgi:hypothetical protein
VSPYTLVTLTAPLPLSPCHYTLCHNSALLAGCHYTRFQATTLWLPLHSCYSLLATTLLHSCYNSALLAATLWLPLHSCHSCHLHSCCSLLATPLSWLLSSGFSPLATMLFLLSPCCYTHVTLSFSLAALSSPLHPCYSSSPYQSGVVTRVQHPGESSKSVGEQQECSGEERVTRVWWQPEGSGQESGIVTRV